MTQRPPLPPPRVLSSQLHTNDFVVAAKTDEIAKEAEGRKQ